MKSVIPTYILIIGFSILMLASSSLIAFQLQITGARNFHTNAISRIQSSYYSSAAITDLQGKASDRGYKLEVQDISVYPDDRKDILVTLSYDAYMPLFGVTKHGIIEGFAK